MRKIISLVPVLMFGFSLVIFVGNQKTKTSSIRPQALLYENTDVGESDGHYVSSEFATLKSKEIDFSNKLNIV